MLANDHKISNYLMATDLLIVFVIGSQIWILLEISLPEVYDIIQSSNTFYASYGSTDVRSLLILIYINQSSSNP
jgi:hypothetical protein